MPVVIHSNPNFPYQVGPNGSQAYVQQLSYRQCIGQVCQWNPDLDPQVAGRFINDAMREVVDSYQWYALKVRGNINVPTITKTGTCTVTNNSNLVVGIGTSWTTALIGLQFRSGFSGPWRTIFNVDPIAQVLTIDTPYGGKTRQSGYQIQAVYETLGANIKYLLHSKNQNQGWPIEVNGNQETLDNWDTWRISLGWTTYFATLPPTPDGQFQIEMWPTPYQAQVFPFEAYIQPPDMVLDNDSPPSFIRADVLVRRAIADAKLFGGRQSKYYDPLVAGQKMKEFYATLEQMQNASNQLDQTDVTWLYGAEDGRVGFGPGSTWAQSHDA
jgi:hypothetical protein